MRRYGLAMVVMFLSFTGLSVAFATGTELVRVAAPEVAEPGLLDLAKPILEAVRSGQGFAAAALALVFAVAAVRRYASPRFPWLASDVGGTLLNLLASLGGALATALAAGTAPSLGLLASALGVAFAAAGGYSAAKRLLAPLLEKLKSKAPAWAAPIFDLALWVFAKPSAVAKAEAAGAAAVEAHPPGGLEGIAGGKVKRFP